MLAGGHTLPETCFQEQVAWYVPGHMGNCEVRDPLAITDNPTWFAQNFPAVFSLEFQTTLPYYPEIKCQNDIIYTFLPEKIEIKFLL